MFGSPVLEVIIGLVFIYLLFSLLSTVVNEIIASTARLRAKNLHKAIQRMLDDDSGTGKFSKLSDTFYQHPMVKYLGSNPGKKPSYLEPHTFARVVSDIIQMGEDKTLDQKHRGELSRQLDAMAIPPETTTLLKSFALDANDDWEIFESKLESWFNETMERAKGWYNRKLKVITFFVGLLIAVSFNVDTIHIYDLLQENASVREELLQVAADYVSKEAEASPGTGNELQDVSSQLGSLLVEQTGPKSQLLGIGWNAKDPFDCESFTRCLLLKIVGWLITALAISLGAPFWFDLLNKLIRLRATGGQPEKK